MGTLSGEATVPFSICLPFPMGVNSLRKEFAPLGRTPDPGQETKAKMVWPCLKVFWFSKDNPTGHSERKKKKRQTEEEVGRQYQRVDRNGLCQLN